jgi:GDP-4-dehydro-6-deoxy-D-mannose reductase
MPGIVLITGATGFTGGFLRDAYSRQGWEVHGTCLEHGPDKPALETGTLHRVDLRDAAATAGLVDRVRPDVVQHLAGQSSVQLSWRDPSGTILGNIQAQLNTLEAIRKHVPSARVVVIGSCDEYGATTPEENPLDESHDLRPTSPYAVSKVAQDLMGLQYWSAWNVDTIRVRPFLQLGPRRTDRFVAGSFARQVAEISLGMREPVITVGSVDIVRDFTDVRDVARALVAVAEHGRAGEVYNLASGRGRTLRELLVIMMSTAGVDADIRPEQSFRRLQESRVLIGDSSRLRSCTGWEPAISFEQSAADTLSYWRERLRNQKASKA